MREERMLELIGQVDCKYIEEANPLNKKKYGYWMKWCAAAACVGIFVLGAVLGNAWYEKQNTEVSYICMDVNPSFELCLNHHDEVVDVITYNEDAKKALEGLSLHKKDCADAVQMILHHENFSEYLKDDLTVTIVSEKESELCEMIEKCMNEAECSGTVTCADSETRETAQKYECSVGKYIAYEELNQYDENITIEECKEMTMHEIHERIDECKNGHHEIENGETSENSGGHGSHHSGHH